MRTRTPSRVLVCGSHLDRNTAALSRGSGAHEDQHALVVDIETPLGLEVQGATPGQRIHIDAPASESTNDRPIRVQRREVELGVGRKQP
jgi:hypothetical protein